MSDVRPCRCGYVMPRVDVFVETDYPPPKRVVAILVCPKCGATHEHSKGNDDVRRHVPT
jgi:hypothetical protein